MYQNNLIIYMNKYNILGMFVSENYTTTVFTQHCGQRQLS